MEAFYYYLIAAFAVCTITILIISWIVVRNLKKQNEKLNDLIKDVNLKMTRNNVCQKRIDIALLTELSRSVYMQKVTNIAIKELANPNRASNEKLKDAINVVSKIHEGFDERHGKIVSIINENEARLVEERKD